MLLPPNSLFLLSLLSLLSLLPLLPTLTHADYHTCPSTCEQCPGGTADYNMASDMYYCIADHGCCCNPAESIKPPPTGYNCSQYCSDCNNGTASVSYKTSKGPLDTVFYYCENKNTAVSQDGQGHCSCVPPPLVRDIRPGYTPGAGGLHIVQYQRRESAAGENPTANFELDVRVFDGKAPVQNLVGAVYKATALPGVAVLVTSNLPHVLKVTAFAEDKDALMLQYAALTFFTNGTQCTVGRKGNGYHNGQRSIDCGLTV